MSALHAWPDDHSAEIGLKLGYHPRSPSRINSPNLAVTFRGKSYQTQNWSLSGMLICGYGGALAPGDAFEVDMIGMPGRTAWPVLIHARVIRVGGIDGMEMAAQFVTLNAPAYDILEGISMRRPGFRGAS